MWNPIRCAGSVRLSDLGEQFTDDTLKAAVEEQIDGGSLAFGETDGAFALAGGTARFSGFTAKASTIEAEGDAAIDLNALTVDSDFKLTFRDEQATSDEAAAGPVFDLVFSGPLSAPVREVDALPFGSYLNARQAAHMLDQIARVEAERAERQQYALFLQKSREYTAEVERQKKEAAERAAAELAQLAEAAAAARDLALEVAAAADARAAEVRANAVAAAKEAAELDAQATAAEKSAADGTAVNGMAALRQAANVARDQAASLSTDADAADAFATSARMEAEAKTAAAAAAAEKAGVPVIAVKTKPAPLAPSPKPKPKVSRPLSATSRPLVITP